LTADYDQLQFLRVLRSHQVEPITDAGALIAAPPVQGPPRPPVTPEPSGDSNG
jgi:rod shape-determining protein MreC